MKSLGQQMKTSPAQGLAGMGGSYGQAQSGQSGAQSQGVTLEDIARQRRELAEQAIKAQDYDPTGKQMWGALARAGAQLASAGGNRNVSFGEGIGNALTAGQNSLSQSRQTNRQDAAAKIEAKQKQLQSLQDMLTNEREFKAGRSDERFDRRIGLGELGISRQNAESMAQHRRAQDSLGQARLASQDRYRQGRLNNDRIGLSQDAAYNKARIEAKRAQAAKYRADAGALAAGGAIRPQDYGDVVNGYGAYLDSKETEAGGGGPFGGSNPVQNVMSMEEWAADQGYMKRSAPTVNNPDQARSYYQDNL